MNMNYKIITAIHGDEIAPVIAMALLNKEQLIANPKALVKKKRFIFKDMNASFGVDDEYYEAKRAREILQQIEKSEIVIDLHTFVGKSPSFVIVVDKKMLPLACSLGFSRIIYMKRNPKKGHALINHRNGVSVELGRDQDIATVVQNAKQMFARLDALSGKTLPDLASIHNRKVYEVFSTYKKQGTYVNFRKQQDGNYPVLASSKAFKIHGFYALKARLVKVSELT